MTPLSSAHPAGRQAKARVRTAQLQEGAL
jgi:hypothetical protein